MWKLWSHLALALKACVLSGWQYGEIQRLFLYHRIRHWAHFGYCCKNHSLIQLTKHWFSNQAQRHFTNCFELVCMKSRVYLFSISLIVDFTHLWFVFCKFCYNSKLHFYSFSFNWHRLIFLASGFVVQITEVLI